MGGEAALEPGACYKFCYLDRLCFSFPGIHLRSYQLEGVNWLAQCFQCQNGCILGDEMGLGKTCQVRHSAGNTDHLHAIHGCLHPLITACVPYLGVKYIKQHDKSCLFYFGFLKIVPPPLFSLFCCFIYFFLKHIWEKACLN